MIVAKNRNLRDVSSGILIPGMRYRHPNSSAQILAPPPPPKKNKKQKNKGLLELQTTGKCPKCLFQQCRSIKFKFFRPLSPTVGEEGEGGGLRVTLKRVNLDTSGIFSVYVLQLPFHSKPQSNLKVYKAIIRLQVDDGMVIYRGKL